MAISNHERIGKALNLLKDGLRPFVEREMQAFYRTNWVEMVKETFRDSRLGGDDNPMGDAAALLVLMDRHWGNVFRATLGRAERSLINEIIDVRNRWAHQNPFSGDDADRALDSIARLLTSVSAPEANEVNRMKMELRRVIYDEQACQQTRSRVAAPVYHHREEIDRTLADDEAFVAELRRNMPSAIERGSMAEGIRRHTDKRVPRAHEVVAAVKIFKDDDPGFLGWRDSHPNGYVVNAYRNPTPDYLMLHRTSCPHLNTRVAEGRWTRDFLKVCATSTDDLARWARQTVTESARLKPCHWCKP
jgi:hypothetical protein